MFTIGTPVHIDDNLIIYVQEFHHQKCIEHISNELTKWHFDLAQIPTKFWHKGDMCVAKCRDGTYHRAEIINVGGRGKCRVKHFKFVQNIELFMVTI